MVDIGTRQYYTLTRWHFSHPQADRPHTIHRKGIMRTYSLCRFTVAMIGVSLLATISASTAAAHDGAKLVQVDEQWELVVKTPDTYVLKNEKTTIFVERFEYTPANWTPFT